MGALVTLGLIVLGGEGMRAQESAAPALAVGTRVRVSVDPDRTFTGAVSALSSDALTVRTEDPDTTLVVAFSDLRRLEISRGTRSRLGRGLWMGAAIGVAAGAATTGVLCVDNPRCSGQDGGLTLLFLTTGGAALGTLVGGVVGALSRTDRWETASREDVAVRIGVGPRTVGITLVKIIP